MTSRIIFVCLVLAFISGALGHGFLQVPKSRNFIANQQGREYCHHCLSSGGPSVVQSLTPGGKFPTPTETVSSAVRHTLCGESAQIPASSRVYNPSPVPAVSSLPVYQPGQVMDIEVVITAHHRGHFEFRLCDAAKLSDPTTVTWACMTTLLKRVSVPGELSPVDVNHPERYYLEPECAPNYSKTIKMKYQIPSNLTCERCVMQWWWVSANTCNPPDYGKRSPQPAHVSSGCQWWQSNLPVCGTSYPEEFWNCADIRIAGGAATPGTHTSPPPTKPAVAPAKPVTPPAKPTAPIRAPTKPAAPVRAPTKPAAPVKAPTKPAAPVRAPTKPAAPVRAPTKPAAPVKAPTKPAAPVRAPTKPAAPVKAPAKPAAPKKPAAPAACAALGYQCGGAGWTGPKCCKTGKCQAYLPSYSQCRTDCPAGWLCAKSTDQSVMTSAVDWAKRFFA